MRYCLFILLFALLLSPAALVRAGADESAAASAEPLHVLMLSGSAEYKSALTLPVLKERLEKHYHVRCTIHQVGAKNDALPAPDRLESCDVLVIYVKRMKLPEDQLKLVKRYVAAGKPIVAIRTASHAFQTWPEFDKAILGGSYGGHYNDRPAQVALPDKSPGHPVLAGVKPFPTNGKLYKNPRLADDATVLLTANTDEYVEPVAWTRVHDGARVFYTSLGVAEDFTNENFLRLLTNAVLWTADRPVQRRSIAKTAQAGQDASPASAAE